MSILTGLIRVHSKLCAGHGGYAIDDSVNARVRSRLRVDRAQLISSNRKPAPVTLPTIGAFHGCFLPARLSVRVPPHRGDRLNLVPPPGVRAGGDTAHRHARRAL